MKAKTLMLTAVCWVSACNGQSTVEIPVSQAQETQNGIAGGRIADSCPAKSFDAFLEIYASDPDVRSAYTLPSIAVVDYRDPNSLDNRDLITMQIPKAEYRGFTLQHDTDGFHNVDSAGGVDPGAVDVDIEQRGEDFYVHYIYGMSEGNSWFFVSKDQCWYLASDPEPPTE